ncbi:MAG: hypothetical protein ACJZ8O_01075 [Pirellulaceae bacterium]
MATIDEQSLTAETDCIEDQPLSASELIAQLDQRQDAVMTDLDALSSRIEDLLNECVESNRAGLEEDLEDGQAEALIDNPSEGDTDTANAA